MKANILLYDLKLNLLYANQSSNLILKIDIG